MTPDRNLYPVHRPLKDPPGNAFRTRLVVMVVLVAIAAWLGLYAAALADTSATPGLVQGAAANSRQGIRNLAEEVAQQSVNEQFGQFNLFIIFFVTLGPLKVIPTFVQLTKNANSRLKRQLAFRSTAVSTVVIMLVVLIGRNVLAVWQIQLPALMIAGGILLSLVALKIVLTQYAVQGAQSPPPESPELHLAIVPLAIPTILPPFGIAIALTLMIVATELGLNAGQVITLLLLVMGLNLVSMLAASPILKFMRPVTLRILGFTLGVMQFALGIQFILSGLEIQALVLKILLQDQ